MRNISAESQTWARRAIELINKHPVLEAVGAGFLGSLMIAGCSSGSESQVRNPGFVVTTKVCTNGEDRDVRTHRVEADGQRMTISNDVSGDDESPNLGDSVTVVVYTDGRMEQPVSHGENIDTNPVTDSPPGQAAFAVVDESDKEHPELLFTVLNDGGLGQVTATFECN